ncbi:cytochrome c oxidase assembly protein [Xylanimonas allomyrinae]|uniref:cytochrome c oxidase assembly protein n=1 Tax=Xylanimonas allomyrinae TaxID=2509459 RepID=UPI0024822EF5|nr:cytochrome c oxidase assembly protein [Xylanimonas allomyrinae]
MVLALLVPMLLVLAAPVTLLMRAVPGRRDGSRGPREWVLGFVHSRWGRVVSQPIVAGVVFVVGMIVFYFTPLFDWSLRSHVGHVWMVVHFTLAGYLFANALIGIDPGPNRPAYPQRLLLLFATMAFHAFFGVALMMQTSLLAADWFGNMGRPWGDSAIVDQQTGGSIAWGIGELPTLGLAIGVAVLWTRSDEREARRRDRQADRDGDAELAEYNAMLAKMAGRAPDAAAPGAAAEPTALTAPADAPGPDRPGPG